MPEQPNWDYAMELSPKENPVDKFSIKGSQFEQPLIEFSGACAGCGETSYIKLATQLFGDRMILANATGCSQAWAFVAPGIPYTKNALGHGPAVSNSLFENNAEFSLGMCLSMEAQRKRLLVLVKRLMEGAPELAEVAQAWVDAFEDSETTTKTSQALISALESATLSGDMAKLRDEILMDKEYLTKKSMWMFGGDGWAYDIGFAGLDHVFATGVDVNVIVVDTEVYSNTGGQASKATQIGATAKFAAGGKKNEKKDLGMMLMQYENVYVASVSMGANQNQLVKAMKEAEAHKGPSILIAYAPCIEHGIVKGMGHSLLEAKKAVETGYWFLYRRNPALAAEGKNPFNMDSKEPSYDLDGYMEGEVRFSALRRANPEFAKELTEEATLNAKKKYARFKQLAEQEPLKVE